MIDYICIYDFTFMIIFEVIYIVYMLCYRYIYIMCFNISSQAFAGRKRGKSPWHVEDI